MKIKFVGDCLAPSGYASALRDHVKALTDTGLKPGENIGLEHFAHDRSNSVALDKWWQENFPVMSRVKWDEDIQIHYQTPEMYRFGDFRTIGFTYWETSKIIDYDLKGNDKHNWVKQMNNCEEVWTACTYSEKGFRNSGVNVPTRVFPWPINPRFFGEYECKILNDEMDEDSFIILGMGQWTARKNLQDLILAVTSEFTADENVWLVLKTYLTDTSTKTQLILQNTIRKLKESMVCRNPCKILIVQNFIPDESLPEFMVNADLFVSTSKGEGHGGPVQQAMALGIPTIAPNYSAFEDYSDGFLSTVDYSLEPVHGMMHIPWYGHGQEWARINI
jgi:glycosyltransferase involved in cell wall biosynthesis